MCGQIPNSRLLPKTANNLDVMTYDAASKRWVAMPGGGAGFDPTANQSISGNYSFSKPIQLAQYAGVPDAPIHGHSIYTATSMVESRFFKASGFRHHFDFSGLSQSQTILVPDAGGTMITTEALGGFLKLGTALNVTPSPVYDYAGTVSPLELGTSNVKITQGEFSVYWNYGATGDERFVTGGTNNWLIDKAGSNESALRIRRARGTLSALSPILSGDKIMEFGADGYSSDTNYRRTFNIAITATQNFASNNIGSDARFEKAKNGAGSRETVMAFDSNNNVGIGFTSLSSTTFSAKFHVQGDAVYPIARFANTTGNAYAQINNNGSMLILGNAATETLKIQENQLINVSSGTITGISYLMTGSFASGAGSANFRPISVTYAINNSGVQSGTATGFFLDATETALNGMAHRLIDLKANGTSRMYLTSTGIMYVNYVKVNTGYVEINAGQAFQIDNRLKITNGSTDGTMVIGTYSGTDFNRLMFGGTTISYGSIKRVGTELRFRLADDSNNSPVGASVFKTYSNSADRIGLLLDTNRIYGNGVYMGANYQLMWASVNDDVASTIDLGLARLSAGVLQVTDGSAGCGGLKACFIHTADLSGGGLATARPIRIGAMDIVSVTELNDLGLDRQIAMEHNGNIVYVLASTTQFT